MREIKFRAWDKERKEMFFPSSISWKDGIIWACDVLGNNRYETVVEDSELMQFTGLKDKNGKEIYEGDVLDDAAHVAWSENMAAFVKRPLETGKPDSMLLIFAHNEVTGNIYENPELVK